MRIAAFSHSAGCRILVVHGLVLYFASCMTGCVAPIGADRLTTRLAYGQVEANALRTGNPSAETVAILHRFDLVHLAKRQPDSVVRQLHEKALHTGERGLLFVLAEMSYVAGDHVSRGVKPWEPRDARDYYLGSALYAWLFLFADGTEPPPGPFDRRFRNACDLYNYSLGLALVAQKRSTNGAVQLQGGRRRLPVGETELLLHPGSLAAGLSSFDQILLADQFRVRGLSVRNRKPGLGAPVICVMPENPAWGGIRPCSPGTVLLRGPECLTALGKEGSACSLEVHSAFEDADVAIRGHAVPLEHDLTTFRAYMLTQSSIWKLGNLQFLAPAERIPSQIFLSQPYDPSRIPVLMIHGTFSSPVTWAELGNTLVSDPVLRQRYQIWFFVYGSGNPLVYSIADLRSMLTEKVEELDPAGTNTFLRQMVIIGHSQCGLLTKATAVHTGDRLWNCFSTNRLQDLEIDETRRTELRRLLFLEPLPFVKRVVFIATPHRGSYLSGNFARRLAHRAVSLPGNLVTRGTDMLKLAAGSDAGKFLHGRLPTSLDGMSPRNPGLLAMAELPVTPGIKAHSIIPVKREGDLQKGRDGVVAYQSAHVSYVESELVVRAKHTCLNEPATTEEVRRILREHLKHVESP